jgi:hypothetical protein
VSENFSRRLANCHVAVEGFLQMRVVYCMCLWRRYTCLHADKMTITQYNDFLMRSNKIIVHLLSTAHGRGKCCRIQCASNISERPVNTQSCTETWCAWTECSAPTHQIWTGESCPGTETSRDDAHINCLLCSLHSVVPQVCPPVPGVT